MPSVRSAAATVEQLRPALCQACRVCRLTDPVAQQQGASSTQLQQIARRECADNVSCLVDDTQVSDAEPAHPANRHIGKGVRTDHGERTAHYVADWTLKGDLVVSRQRAYEVALDDDAGLLSTDRPSLHAHKKRRDSRIHHLLESISKRHLRRYKFCGGAHDVSDAMTVRISVDTWPGIIEGDVSGVVCHVHPARAIMLVDRVGQRAQA